MFINTTDLPKNDYNIELLKSLNTSYFHGKGEFLYASPVGQNSLREMGYELYANIKTYIVKDRPFEFSVFINEKMTDLEIQDALKEFKELTDGFMYTVN